MMWSKSASVIGQQISGNSLYYLSSIMEALLGQAAEDVPLVRNSELVTQKTEELFVTSMYTDDNDESYQFRMQKCRCRGKTCWKRELAFSGRNHEIIPAATKVNLGSGGERKVTRRNNHLNLDAGN